MCPKRPYDKKMDFHGQKEKKCFPCSKQGWPAHPAHTPLLATFIQKVGKKKFTHASSYPPPGAMVNFGSLGVLDAPLALWLLSVVLARLAKKNQLEMESGAKKTTNSGDKWKIMEKTNKGSEKERTNDLRTTWILVEGGSGMDSKWCSQQ
jgi:hypothetical protein